MPEDKVLITIVGYKMAKNINHLDNVMLTITVHIVCYNRKSPRLVICLGDGKIFYLFLKYFNIM